MSILFQNTSRSRTGRNKWSSGNRGRPAYGARGKNNSGRLLKLLGGVAFCSAAMAGAGYIALQDANTLKPDAETGCYTQTTAQDSTVAFVDSSDPGFDGVQSRDLIRAFTNLYKRDLGFNEFLSVITTQESRIGTIPDPVIELCGSAKSSAELENIGAAGATAAFLKRQSEKTFEKQVEPQLAEIFAVDPTATNRQSRESPILEQIQSLSRLPAFSDGAAQKQLIIVSDMLQNTTDLQFCKTQGHLPSYFSFKESPEFDRVRPAPLVGTDVTIYLLVRGTLGEAPYAFCTEPELTQWWKDFLTDAGAQSVDVIRIRQGG
ncbi:MAG: hypothetical protein ACSHYC_00160 [Alphaproteobacteria bacterium]